MKNILVFRTTVAGNEDVRMLRPLLNRFINNHGEWNFDLEDCDKILRVESLNLEATNIIRFLQQQGYGCEELPD